MSGYYMEKEWGWDIFCRTYKLNEEDAETFLRYAGKAFGNIAMPYWGMKGLAPLYKKFLGKDLWEQKESELNLRSDEAEYEMVLPFPLSREAIEDVCESFRKHGVHVRISFLRECLHECR